MNIWFLLWVFLAVFILGIFLWSLAILLRQKTAWTAFARKHGLTVQQGRFFSSPRVSGFYKEYPVTLYSEEQIVNQSASRRFRTILQLELNGIMPAPGVIASQEAANFARSLSLKESYLPEVEGWNKNIVVMTDNAEALKTYFTPERVKSLNAIMSIRSIPCILIFDDSDTFLRFETPDPFDDITKLERFSQKVMDQAKILSPNT